MTCVVAEWVKRCLILLALAAAWAPASGAPPAPSALTIIVPSDEGGGWGLLAREMRDTLISSGIVKEARIVFIPGSGGLVGLNRFANTYRGRDDAVLVAGLGLIGAEVSDGGNELGTLAPLARLAGDYRVLAIAANSDISSFAVLVNRMRGRGSALHWAGGSWGGPDQVAARAIAEHSGLPPDDLLYSRHTGGRNVAEAVMSGRQDIGISGYAEFAPFVRAGKLKIIAVLGPQRLPDIDAPTLRELGIDLTVQNWRGACQTNVAGSAKPS